MSDNATPLGILGVFDAHFGFLSAVAALKEHSHTITNNNTDFDIKKLIIKLRQFMALEESYAGSDYAEKNSEAYEEPENVEKDSESGADPDYVIKDSEICHFFEPDKLLFEKAPDTRSIDKFEYFSEFSPEYFTSYDIPPEGEKCYTVSKKIFKKHNRPFLAQPIKDALSLPYVLQSSVDFSNYSIINDERKFKKRVLLTEELNKQLVQLDIAEFVRKNSNVLKDMISQYDFSASLSLVGPIQQYDDQTVVHVLCHYTNSQKKKLAELSIELDDFVPFVFENHSGIKRILKKCANLCRPLGHKCFMGKILGTPLGSDDYCVLFFATFLNDIHRGPQRGPQRGTPIGNLIHDNRERLKAWDFYRRRAEIYSFSLDDVKEEKGGN